MQCKRSSHWSNSQTKGRREALCGLLCEQDTDEEQRNYTTTENELLAVVYYSLDKFRAYLVGSDIIILTSHSALEYLLTK